MIMSILTGAVYAVFLHNLLLSGGLGASEALRAAQRNSELLMTSLLMSLFATASAVLCHLLATLVSLRREIAGEPLPKAWIWLCFALALLALYLLSCGAITLLPLKRKKLLLKRMGMSALNTLVMFVPLLVHNLGKDIFWAVGLGLGAGAAFLVVSLLVNSGMHILQQNKALPSMFTGVPATLIYMGLLALAFTGFTGEILLQ